MLDGAMTAGDDRRADTIATLASRLAEAKAAIAASRFGPWANAISGALVPSIRIHALAQATAGASRFGGEPALPGTMAWPADEKGAAFDFMASISLAEVAALLGKSPLPSTGQLLFFASQAGGGRIVHLPSASGLSVRSTPGGATRHRECSLYLTPEVCLPGPMWLMPLELDDKLPEEWVLDWERLSRTVQGNDRMEHRLLGTASPPPTRLEHWWDDYPREASYAARLMRQELLNGNLRIGPAEGEAETKTEVDDDRFPISILQLDTDVDGPGWSWGRNGRLYFHVDARDLARGNLDSCTVMADGSGPE